MDDMILHQVLLFFFSLLAGMGLILYAMKSLSSGLQGLFSRTIRRIVNIVDTKPINSLLAGSSISILLQSATTPSMMAISYTGSGLLNLRQLMLILLGANLGNILVPFLFLTPFGTLDFFLVAIGSLPMILARSEKISSFGKLTFSVGLLLMGFRLMFVAANNDLVFEIWKEPSAFFFDLQVWMIIAILFASIVLALLIRSVMSLIGFVICLVSFGLLPVDAGLIFIIGFNIGLTIPPLNAAMKSTMVCKRGATSHLISNSVIGLLCIIFLQPIREILLECAQAMNLVVGQHLIIAVDTSLMTQAAILPIFHFLFNLLLVSLFFVLMPVLENALMALLPNKPTKEIQKLQFVGRTSYMAPSLALEQVFQEIKKMAAMIESMLNLANEVLSGKEPNQLQGEDQRVLKYEKILDNLNQEIQTFLSKVMEAHLTTSQASEVKNLLRITDELEVIADSCEQSVIHYKQIQEQLPHQLEIQILALFETVRKCYEITFPFVIGFVNKNIDHATLRTLSDLSKQVEIQALEIEQLTSGLGHPIPYQLSRVVSSICEIENKTQKLVKQVGRFPLRV